MLVLLNAPSNLAPGGGRACSYSCSITFRTELPWGFDMSRPANAIASPRTASATAVSVTTRAALAMLLFGSHTTDSYRAGVLAPVAIMSDAAVIDHFRGSGIAFAMTDLLPWPRRGLGRI